MTAQAAIIPRRGACPGLSAPMPTGDGLLVRLLPIGTMALPSFAGLCAAARAHGNGVIEVTSRGSIQARGLNADSAPRFAAAIAALDIAAADGVPILTDPLAGLAADETLDAGALAAAMRVALARTSLAARLSPKVSVAIDGGGALSLDTIAADIRLRAELTNGEIALRVSVGGDEKTASKIGIVAPHRGTEAVTRMLDVVARRGRDARARDIVAAEGIAVFRSALVDVLSPQSDPCLRKNERTTVAIGVHRLHDATFACGIGLAFGHAEAASLEQLVEAAKDVGANGVRTAPDRTLLVIGLTQPSLSPFRDAAERLGFIVRVDDPRRHVVACVGAPICASAQIASRAIAPDIVACAGPLLDGSFEIHVSGCAKGCAHAAAATLTVVGTSEGCALIADGSARDVPFAVASASELPAAIAKHICARQQEAGHV